MTVRASAPIALGVAILLTGAASASAAPGGWEERIFAALDRADFKTAQRAHADWRAHKGERNPQYWVAGANVWGAMATKSSLKLSVVLPGSSAAAGPAKDNIALRSSHRKVVGTISDGPTRYDAQKLRRAIGFLDEGIRRNPQRFDMYVGRARLYRTIGDLDGELVALTSMAREPHAAPGATLEGGAGEPLDRPLDQAAVAMLNAFAAEHLEEKTAPGIKAGKAVAELLIKLFPLRPHGYSLLAAAASQRANWGEAARQLERALKHAPDDALVIANLGYCLEQSGDKAGAVARYRLVVELDDDPGEVARAKTRLAELTGSGATVKPAPAKKPTP
jgi:tetratricopeptide (TPR) repeat protein